MELLSQHQMIPGQTAGFFQGAVRGAHGQFAGTLDFQTVSLAASQAAALQLAAATIALRVAVEDVQQAVAKVEGKVDELLARARANDVGPVVAHHAVLAEMTATLDREGSLPSTDWDTVQHLGANVPGAIELCAATSLRTSRSSTPTLRHRTGHDVAESCRGRPDRSDAAAPRAGRGLLLPVATATP